MLPWISRVILVVLDGAGVGALPDAGAYGDGGADTLGHVLAACDLRIPNLRRLGLGEVLGMGAEGCAGGVRAAALQGAYGRLAERSVGKDSTVGHWELTGVVTRRAFATYPQGFPAEIVADLVALTGRGVIGNRPASGTRIIEDLYEEHARTGSWIVYTSADSVLQIAAHEAVVPAEELYRACGAAAEMLLPRGVVLRVIARPFAGTPGHLRRMPGRRDYNPTPPGTTALDRISAAFLPVVTLGKVDGLYPTNCVTDAIHTTSNSETLAALHDEVAMSRGGLVFANLVDFDMLYGHRNDVAGYARALEAADEALGEVMAALRDRDVLIITGDHGCDPTTPGTDHTREYVPVLVCGKCVRAGVNLGTRECFGDVGATVCAALGLRGPDTGKSFWQDICAPGKVEPQRVAAARDRWYGGWDGLRARAG